MSCWVVPAIAAELWGVTVEHVLARVRDGSVESRREHGFTFVDATPAACHSHFTARREGPAPPTFVPVRVTEELPSEEDGAAHEDATLDFEWVSQIEDPPEELAPAAAASPEAVEDDELPPLCEEEDDRPLPPRDAFRAAVARRRRPPLAA